MPCNKEGLTGCGLCRGLVSLGNLLSLSESLSHLQFWGLQLLPYVGCLCLHDPSHINVIIRASIYTGFLLSSNSSCLRERFTSSSLHGWFRAYYSILCSRTDWEEEAGREEKCGRDGEREGPNASHFQFHEDDGGWSGAPCRPLCSSRLGLPSMNSPLAARWSLMSYN